MANLPTNNTMFDGSRLHESWLTALDQAQSHFKSLLTNSSSIEWKRVSIPTPSSSRDSQSSAPLPHAKVSRPRVSDVSVHRRTTKAGDVLRVSVELPAEESLESIDAWKAILTTPELRKEWDPTVESSAIVETCFGPETRLSRTEFSLGWPANPRDAITISRTFTDPTTLIDISTSLPRSPDEPAYLRPKPPYVRSYVQLFAWCIQFLQPPDSSSKASNPQSRVRVTCFWQHDLKAIWGLANLSQNLPSMAIGLVRTVRKRGRRTPIMTGWGNGVGIDDVNFNVGREALKVEYSIFPEEDGTVAEAKDLEAMKERKRLERSVEVIVSLSQGWDVQITQRSSSDETSKSPWTLNATRLSLPIPPSPTISTSRPGSSPSDPPQPQSANPSNSPTELAVLRFSHPRPAENTILRVKITIELSGGSNGIRVNGNPHPISDVSSRDHTPTPFPGLLQDGASSISLQTVSTASSIPHSPMVRSSSDRSPAAEKSILSLVRRNYIYFTSLLQEPEAKWRHLSESRGVTISQLDSIDPTLVVYRAEALFVGIGVWDLLSIVKTPGSKIFWDKSFDDAVLTEDVNELTELWHHTTKAAWPVNARDTVLLTTSYKSPNSVHVFSFSTDDRHLFPSIPESDPTIIRTQVDLQGWAIEALSPTTTLLTLIDQSDPKGWSNKSSIPQQMVAALAGVGEFSIKCGGPPVATRFGGAKVLSMKYDHDKTTYKVEYEANETRRHSLVSTNDMLHTPAEESIIDLSQPSSGRASSARQVEVQAPRIECEIRCDVDTWSPTIELVVDPPPQGVSCLKRHRFSSGGGGLWITIEHDAMFVGEDRLLVSVRKGTVSGSSKDKTVVIVNGLRVKVDVEDIPETEVKALAKQKRVKPPRIPLDQPPVLAVIKRRRTEWEEEALQDQKSTSNSPPKDGSAPRYSSPLTKFFSAAVDSTVATGAAAAAAFTPATSVASIGPDPHSHPLEGSLLALEYMRGYHSGASRNGWTLASDKGGMIVQKKMESQISSAIALHKAEKVIEGLSAGDVAAAITNMDSQQAWDDRLVSYTTIEGYGNSASSAFVVRTSGFPFRNRGFWVSSAVARLVNKSSSDSNAPYSPTILIASRSFPPSLLPHLSISKTDPMTLPEGYLIMSGWIIEAVDPYQADLNYSIPSTRCVHFVAMDYRGSVPIAFNSSMNALLPRTEILALETWLRNSKGLNAGPHLRVPALMFTLERAISPSAGETSLADAEDRPTELRWGLQTKDSGRSLLASGSNPSELSFTFRLRLNPDFINIVLARDETRATLSRLRSKSRRMSSITSGLDVSADRRPSSSTPTSTTTGTMPGYLESPLPGSLRGRRTSGSVTPVRPPLPSHQRYPSSSNVSTPGTPFKVSQHERTRTFSSLSNDECVIDSPPDEPIIAEVVLNPALFPSGFSVELFNVTVVDKIHDLSKHLEGMEIPISGTVYTIPPSPLLSRSEDQPSSRHLLVLTLPISQYFGAPVLDPLSGDEILPLPKPSWLLAFEKVGADIEIRVSPSPKEGNTEAKYVLSGKELVVHNERKSLSAVGRDYLDEEGTQHLPLLQLRVPKEGSEVFPEGTPLARNLTLFLEAHEPSNGLTESPTETNTLPKDNTASVAAPVDTSDLATLPRPPSNFFTLWNVSSSLLGLKPATVEPDAVTEAKAPVGPSLGTQPKAPVLDAAESTPLAEVTQKASESLGAAVVAISRVDRERYRISTIVLVALVSFLCGSLMRSLASPADFVYLPDPAKRAEAMSNMAVDGPSSWREIRRLFELKRGLFGWDLVLAVVRR